MVPTIKELGWNDKSSREYIAVWEWNEGHTKSFEVVWSYDRTGPSGNGIRVTGARHTIDGRDRQDTFTVPVEATFLYFEITAISETYQVNGGDATYWTGDTLIEQRYVHDNAPPDKPAAVAPYINETDKNVMSVKISNIFDSDNNQFVGQVEYDIREITDFGLETESAVAIDRKFTRVSDYGTTKFSMTVNAGKSYIMRVRYISSAGGVEVRPDSIRSEWSDFSEVVYGPPVPPVIDTENTWAESMNSIKVSWAPIPNAYNYEVEYTTDAKFFDSGTGTTIVPSAEGHSDIIITGLDPNYYYVRVRTLAGSAESAAKSSWSDYVSIGVGTKPNPPSTWTMRSVAYFGEDSTIRLNWIHNSPDNSRERLGVVTIIIRYEDTVDMKSYRVEKEVDPHKPYDPTSYLDLDISEYKEGTSIDWMVQTEGATEELSGRSISRRISIYKKPSLTLSIHDLVDTEGFPKIESYPLSFETNVDINGLQKPIGYSVSVTSMESYQTIDSMGRPKTVNTGDVIFNRYINNPDNLEMEIGANEINLLSYRRYKLMVVVSMTTGLTSSAEQQFTCGFKNTDLRLTAQFMYNKDSESLSINMIGYQNGQTTIGRPKDAGAYKIDKHYPDRDINPDFYYIEYAFYPYKSRWDGVYNDRNYIDYVLFDIIPDEEIYSLTLNLEYVSFPVYVDKNEVCSFMADRYKNGRYVGETEISFDTKIIPLPGGAVYDKWDTVIFESGDWEYRNVRVRMFKNDILDKNLMWIKATMTNAKGESKSLPYTVEGQVHVPCVMSLYRKNDDGSFTTIIENVENGETNWVVDPHPQLNYASYRMVAKDEYGGYHVNDLPPYPINCKEIILQWDEVYTISNNDGLDPEYVGQVNGTMLRLPYNIDWDENADIETNMVKYVGRKDPVAYYGTHTGYTASGSTDIPKADKETIRMLRKLQVYMGNVYVREPSGTGYWAQVKVKFPQKHCDVIVPVSLDVTRVEGGM